MKFHSSPQCGDRKKYHGKLGYYVLVDENYRSSANFSKYGLIS